MDWDSIKWIIRADEPYKGHTQSFLDPNGFVAYTGEKVTETVGNTTTISFKNPLTLEEYEKERGFKCKVITSEELDKLNEEFDNRLKTNPEPITLERFYDMLEVLPPCRWHTVRGFEVFHVSERYRGNLVSWFARSVSNDVVYCYEFMDDASMSDDEIFKKLFAVHPKAYVEPKE